MNNQHDREWSIKKLPNGGIEVKLKMSEKALQDWIENHKGDTLMKIFYLKDENDAT